MPAPCLVAGTTAELERGARLCRIRVAGGKLMCATCRGVTSLLGYGGIAESHNRTLRSDVELAHTPVESQPLRLGADNSLRDATGCASNLTSESRNDT